MHIKKGKFDSSFSKDISACRHKIFYSSVGFHPLKVFVVVETINL